MKLIGTGAFSKVYRDSKSNRVHIKSNDFTKECMALGWFPSARCFPKVSESDKQGYDYTMPYYPKKSSLKQALKPSEYQKYQELREIFSTYPGGYYELRAVFKGISSRTLRKHMLAALDALVNYGEDIGFEISPRNVAVSPSGNLILLDVFFFHKQLQEVRA